MIRPPSVPADPLAKVDAEAERLAAFGAGDLARVVQATAGQARQAWIDWWNESLTTAQAEAYGGYSGAQLRNLLRDGTIPRAPDGGIRRRHIPIRPGHDIPLAIEPAEVADSDWTERVRRNRAVGGSR